MSHPYTDLPAQAFWRSGVVSTDRTDWPGLYSPKIALSRETRIATMGSCFAQHIGPALRAAGCTVSDVEPAPKAMPDDIARSFGYGLFSARYGNIYTTRQLLDLLREIASGAADPRFVWEKAGRFYDAFRPNVEPEGLDTVDEVLLHRDYHLERTAQLLRQTDVLIFTLGLTETWVDRGTGRAFPVCPGVVAGTFKPAVHRLVTLTHSEVLDDLMRIHALLQRFNPGMKLLLTVSPVPMTATASGQHVLIANSQSKATLRAAAGECAATLADVDYVPSYELITHPAMGDWFDPNMRSVSAAGVARVMGLFLAAHGLQDQTDSEAADCEDPPEDTAQCDDLLLDAFAPLAASA
jgi:GSCFA family